MMRSSTGSSQFSIYNYPDHLNPFAEDDHHKRLRFWKFPKRGDDSRRRSFSMGNLRELWQLKSFSLKKKSSTLGIQKTSESPPVMRRSLEPSPYGHASLQPGKTPFVYRDPLRRSLQDINTSTAAATRRLGSNLANGRNGSISSTGYLSPHFQKYQPSRSSQSSLNSTNPFESDIDSDVTDIDVSRAGIKRSYRKKRKAPLAPNQINKSAGTEQIENIAIRSLANEIENFVHNRDEDSPPKKSSTNNDNTLHISENTCDDKTIGRENVSGGNPTILRIDCEDLHIDESQPAEKNVKRENIKEIPTLRIDCEDLHPACPVTSTSAKVQHQNDTITIITPTKQSQITHTEVTHTTFGKPLNHDPKRNNIPQNSDQLATNDKICSEAKISYEKSITKAPNEGVETVDVQETSLPVKIEEGSVQQHKETTQGVTPKATPRVAKRVDSLGNKLLKNHSESQQIETPKVTFANDTSLRIDSENISAECPTTSRVENQEIKRNSEIVASASTVTSVQMSTQVVTKPCDQKPIIKAKTPEVKRKNVEQEANSNSETIKNKTNFVAQAEQKPIERKTPDVKRKNDNQDKARLSESERSTSYEAQAVEKPMVKPKTPEVIQKNLKQEVKRSSVFKRTTSVESEVVYAIPDPTRSAQEPKTSGIAMEDTIRSIAIRSSQRAAATENVHIDRSSRNLDDGKNLNDLTIRKYSYNGSNNAERAEYLSAVRNNNHKAHNVEYVNKPLAISENNNSDGAKAKSVKEIIDSINRSQKLLKESAEKGTKVYSTSLYAENNNSISPSGERLCSPVLTPNISSDCPPIECESSEVQQQDFFQKSKINKTAFQNHRESSPTALNLDWNPLPKPKRINNSNNSNSGSTM